MQKGALFARLVDMAVPKQHRSKSRQGQRRMHYFIKEQSFVLCGHCGKDSLPHRVCPSCGYYKGHEVIDTLSGLTKKERKQKEKELAASKKLKV